MVDNLTAIEPDTAHWTRLEQVERTCRQLKQLARELDVPIVALSRVKSWGVNWPTLRDLRYSTAIVAEADVVLLLHRRDYYDPGDRPGHALVIIAQDRAGSTDTIDLEFERLIPRFAKFVPDDPLGPF